MNLEHSIERVARAQAAHPVRFLVVAAVLTALSVPGLATLHFDSSYEALMPEDEPRLVNMHDVRARTGGTRQVVVAVAGSDPAARDAFAERLAPELEALDHVRYVDVRFPVDFFEKRGLLMLPAKTLDELVEAVGEAIDQTRWFENPMNPHLDEEQEKADLEKAWKRVSSIGERETADLPRQGTMQSKDGRWRFVVVIPSIKFEDIETGRQFNEHIRSVVARLDPGAQGLEVRYAGNLEIMQEQHVVLRSDLRLASVIALALGVLLVTVFTRRTLAPLAVGLPLVCGVMWTFGIVGITLGHVNIITGFLVAVLIGLGIDFGVHLFVRYQQERDLCEDPSEAMVAAVIHTLRPALTSGGTTAATFLSFGLARFRGFSEFGLIASMGVMLTLVSSFLILPPLMILVDRKLGPRSHGRTTLVTRAQGRLPVPLCVAVVAVFVGLAALGLGEMPSIRFENDFRKLRGDSPAYEFFDYVNRNMGAGFNPAVFLLDDLDHARVLARRVRQMREDGTGSRFGRIVAAPDFLPVDPDEGMERVLKLREMVADPRLDRAKGERAEQLARARELAGVQPWTVEDLPEPIRRRFVTLDGKQSLAYLWPDRPNYTADQATAWEGQLDALTDSLLADGVGCEMAEETLITGWVHRLVRSEAPALLAIAALVVVLLLLLDFRRVRDALLVATPLVVGMLVFVALMWATGQDLNLYNIIVVPSIVGIGIDNSVHIYHRYRRGGRGTVLQAMVGTGVAALLASATTAVGFGSSLVAHMQGLRSMGVLAMTGIGATFVAAVVFFPCLLALIEMVRSRTQSANG